MATVSLHVVLAASLSNEFNESIFKPNLVEGLISLLKMPSSDLYILMFGLNICSSILLDI